MTLSNKIIKTETYNYRNDGLNHQIWHMLMFNV